MKRVVLVGLGLIGGSVGQALRAHRPQLELVGVDRESVIQTDSVRSLLTDSFPVEGLSASDRRGLDADLIVLAIPVRAITEGVCDWLAPGAPLTDCGSTKQVIVRAAQACPGYDWFVPGHPMAGRERGGYESASPDLFRGRPWIVCPQGANTRACDATRAMVEAVGAHWTELTPHEHDLAVAMTSHLPQILASWLAASTSESQRRAAGPAFADMTRVAGGSESIWRDIFETNAGPLAAAVRRASEDLRALAEDLGASEPRIQQALELLARARRQSPP
jgi:prephenate dehydrogenase